MLVSIIKFIYVITCIYSFTYMSVCFALCMKVAFCHRGYMIFVFWGPAYITGHNVLLKWCLGAGAIRSRDACPCLQELEDLGNISLFEIGCCQFTMTEKHWHSPGRSREGTDCTTELQDCDIWYHSQSYWDKLWYWGKGLLIFRLLRLAIKMWSS